MDFTGKYIENTYEKVLHIHSGSMYDGTGSYVSPTISGSFSVIGDVLVTSGSVYVDGEVLGAGGGGETPYYLKNITLPSGSWYLSGSLYAYDYDNIYITLNSHLDITPHNSSVSVVGQAELFPLILVKTLGTASLNAVYSPTDDINVNILITETLQPPQALSLSISGSMIENTSVTGSYTYYDSNGDTEGESTFKWYSADDINGTNKTELTFTTTELVISSSEADKYLIFEVTPISITAPEIGNTAEVYSTSNVLSPPQALSLSITGSLEVSQSVTGNYTFYDPNGDAEGTTTFKWYRSDDEIGTNKTELTAFTSTSMAISASEEDKYLIFEVTPISVTTPFSGSSTEVYSATSASAAPVFSYSTEYQAIYDEFSTKPSSDDATAQDTFVTTLVDGGVWSETDRMFVLASHASGRDSVLDWIHPTVLGNDATLVNSPTHTLKQGYLGNGTSQFMNLNYNPSNSLVRSVNDSFISIYSRTNLYATQDYDYGGLDGSSIERINLYGSTSPNAYLFINNIGNILTNNFSNSSMMFTGVDIGDGNVDIRINDNAVVEHITSDTSLEVNTDMYLLANSNNGTPYLWSERQISFWATGAKLTQTQSLTLYNAFQTLMTHYGTQV